MVAVGDKVIPASPMRMSPTNPTSPTKRPRGRRLHAASTPLKAGTHESVENLQENPYIYRL